MDKPQFTREQRFKWGRYQWFVEPRNLGTDRLSAGLVTFEPGARQDYHQHNREEQVLYVISGSGLHWQDEVEKRIGRGDILHIPQYSRHRVHNDSDEPLVFLIVYAPVMQHLPLKGDFSPVPDGPEGPVAPDPAVAPAPEDGFLSPELVRTIREFMVPMSEALDLSLTLLDREGNFVLKTDNHPEFCRLMAEAAADNFCIRRLKEVLLDAAPGEGGLQPLQFACCNKIASTIVPIVHEGRVQAWIKCGEIFLSEEDKEEALARAAELGALCGQPAARMRLAGQAIPVERISVLHTASAAILSAAASIVNLGIMNRRQKELTRAQLAQANLEKSLQEADLKILQAQVAPHFLFNTLSTIAQAAYLEGADKAGELAWHLSDLLRFTLRKTERLISLNEELELLTHYISIQAERFGDRLAFEVRADEEAGPALVPCMLLQPLVENSIIHGFSGDKKSGRVSVRVSLKDGRVKASVSDDGCGFDLSALQARTDKIGLHSSRLRLEHYFGQEAAFTIKSAPGSGTSIEMSFPAAAGGKP